MTITVKEFFKLPEVIQCQDIQKQNPYGSSEHRNATSDMLAIAKDHSVDQHFETMGTYEEELEIIKKRRAA